MTSSNWQFDTEKSLVESHGLKLDEFEKIVEGLGREPNLTELGIFSAMWNEHCSYKSSKYWLKKLPTSGERVIQVPGENAGVIDIDDGDVSGIVELIKKYNIQGIIISNTTDSNRENLSDIKRNEVGGLSVHPLKDISTNLIKKFYKITKGRVKIIGVGGVDSGQTAFEKITAGADAVQLYTGMVYKGPGIVKEIKKDLISILKKESLKNISEAVGINA